MRGLAAALIAVLALTGVQARAQGAPSSPIMTVDQDRLYASSQWGQRVQAELEQASGELQAQNRRIEAELTAEEKSLTEQRATLPPEEFRALADAFDVRVTAIRKTQDTKVRDLTLMQDEERRRFFEAAIPVMGEVMETQGAFAILDARAVLMSVRAIDATDEILRAVDARLGDGAAAQAP